MPDLPDSSFTAVNDVETAQGAPVSEALAQKYGSNENNLDARVTSNDTDIATNVTNIATNTTNISTNTTAINLRTRREVFDVTTAGAAVNTFGTAPDAVIVNSAHASQTVIVTQATNAVADKGTTTQTFSLSGTSLTVSPGVSNTYSGIGIFL